MVVADLHVHTTNSDGTLALADVPEAASDAGLDFVAITDHDRPHPGLEGPAERRDGVVVVHGIELRVAVQEGVGDVDRVDLLGYGLDPTPELEAACERLGRDRAARGRAMVECVEDRLDLTLDVDPGPGFGRPHLARAVAARTDLSIDDVFADVIGDDQPCYRPRDVPSFEDGVELLSDACAVVGLAHPLRYEDSAAALGLCDRLDAVERWYPYGTDVDPTPVERAIERYDCLPTGGSDAHDAVLGRSGLDEGALGAVRTAMGQRWPDVG